jgi:hypothetical protein
LSNYSNYLIQLGRFYKRSLIIVCSNSPKFKQIIWKILILRWYDHFKEVIDCPSSYQSVLNDCDKWVWKVTLFVITFVFLDKVVGHFLRDGYLWDSFYQIKFWLSNDSNYLIQSGGFHKRSLIIVCSNSFKFEHLIWEDLNYGLVCPL